MIKSRHRVLGAAVVLAGVVLAGSAGAAGVDDAQAPPDQPPALPVGQTVNGQTGDEAPMVYRFTFPRSGALSVVVRSDDDIQIAVSDTFGQDLLDGRGDMDLHGQPGAEQAVLTAGAGQVIDIEIGNWDNGVCPFQITAGFIAIEGMEVAPDPGGNPGDATDLILGQPFVGQLNADEADRRDWYRLEVPAAGYLCVFTDSAVPLPADAPAGDADEAAGLELPAELPVELRKFAGEFGGFGGFGGHEDHGDVVLEAFVDGEFRDTLAYSDNDTQGRGTRESFLLTVEPGEVYYFRVSGFGGAAQYSICAAMVTMNPGMAAR